MRLNFGLPTCTTDSESFDSMNGLRPRFGRSVSFWLSITCPVEASAVLINCPSAQRALKRLAQQHRRTHQERTHVSHSFSFVGIFGAVSRSGGPRYPIFSTAALNLFISSCVPTVTRTLVGHACHTRPIMIF